jgi:hypothetical protein
MLKYFGFATTFAAGLVIGNGFILVGSLIALAGAAMIVKSNF